jgi:TRAP-type C4-dicarboxylate transport system permease small subunit
MATQASSTHASGVRSTIKNVEKYTSTVSRWLYWIAGAGLIGMLALVVADIVGIKALSHPVPGGIEVVGFLGVVVIGFAIAYVQVLHGHIQVDFIVMKLPERPRAIIEAITTLMGVAFFVFLSWRTFDYARSLQLSGEVSMTQKIPFFPFIYGLAVCYVVTTLVLILEFMKAILKVGQRWTQ